MNERDGQETIALRLKAAEQIALEAFIELCAPLSETVCKARLEAAIQRVMQEIQRSNQK